MTRFGSRGGMATVGTVALLAGLAGLVAMAAAATPASAEPASSEAVSTAQPEAVFFQALDRAGVGHPDNGQAASAAGSVCQRTRDLFSDAEIADDLEEANPGLQHPHAVAFVTIARAVYCPGVGVGELPGYPGGE